MTIAPVNPRHRRGRKHWAIRPRPFKLGLWIALLAVQLFSAPGAAETPEGIDPILRRVWEAHNQERTRMGLPPLHLHRLLMAAAQLHAQDMATRQTLTHRGADGSTPAQRMERQGYRYGHSGENVAAGQQTVQEVMQSWLQSPAHRQNILGDFADIGVARALDASRRPYWCVTFGKIGRSP